MLAKKIKKFFKGFTLVEVLIVVAILSVLGVGVVFIINPAEKLKETRDVSRLSDLKTLNNAVALYATDVGSGFGSPQTVYLSLPDSSPTCASYPLPTLPGGWSYACAPSSTYRAVNSTGWVPINFSQISFGSPLSVLPIDPVNTVEDGLYYTYVVGSWEFTANMESQAYRLGGQRDVISGDKGDSNFRFEFGSDLTLTPEIGEGGVIPVSDLVPPNIYAWSFEGSDDTSASGAFTTGGTNPWILGSVWNRDPLAHTGSQSAKLTIPAPNANDVGTPAYYRLNPDQNHLFMRAYYYWSANYDTNSNAKVFKMYLPNFDGGTANGESLVTFYVDNSGDRWRLFWGRWDPFGPRDANMNGIPLKANYKDKWTCVELELDMRSYPNVIGNVWLDGVQHWNSSITATEPVPPLGATVDWTHFYGVADSTTQEQYVWADDYAISTQRIGC